MSKEFDTHIAGVALHLSKLNDQSDIPNASEGEYIGELTSASAGFALNSIPTITVSAPYGARVKDGKFEPSYAYEKLEEAITNREAVGVYLDVISTDSSFPGLEANSCLCIFKGYILESATDNGTEGGKCQFGIVHWLIDLASVAIVNRLSSPDNPADISADSVFEQFDENSKKVKHSWMPGNEYVEAIKTAPTLFDAIKAGITHAMYDDEKLTDGQPGKITEPLSKKLSKALDAVKAKSLEFKSDLAIPEDKLLINAISEALSTETRAAYYSVTIWQKLIQGFLPMFYMTLTPLIDNAYVIPQPGIQISDDVCVEIDDSMVISLSVRAKHGKMLGGVYISARSTTNDPALLTIPSRATTFQYPNPAKTGVMKACMLPAWLEAAQMISSLLTSNSISSTGFAMENASEMASANTVQEKDSLYGRLCETFVKTVYHAEVTRGNTATVTTVLNLSLAPGMAVKVKVPTDKIVEDKIKEKYVYGVIESLQNTISNTAMQTILKLSDVRIGAQMKEFELDNALLYEKAWDGSDGNLYVWESQLNSYGRIEDNKHK